MAYGRDQFPVTWTREEIKKRFLEQRPYFLREAKNGAHLILQIGHLAPFFSLGGSEIGKLELNPAVSPQGPFQFSYE